MTKAKIYEGGCLCGHIRFSATSPVLQPHTCSCRQCQRHSGALTQTWVEFARDQLQWTGPGGAPSRWRSSQGSSRAFCPVCGSTLGALDDKPTLAIAVGTFDSPNRKELAPLAHSHVSKRPSWWGLCDPREA
ncbi:GFA family protein [Polaromonas sp. UC242_47]|uniref:GFA family protein n=1 Tax=Polaromonas sp. UC242_47 TaxID=3374626 RepID=UPI0037B94E80